MLISNVKLNHSQWVWITSSGRRGNHLLNFILGSSDHFFLSHQSNLAFEMWERVKNLDQGDADSHVPSDNDASLLAVNHYISVWAGHTTGQQSTHLFGTQQHSGHANQAHVPGKSGLSPTAIFAMAVECSSTEKPASNPVRNIACCCWSRTPIQGATAMYPLSHYTH